MYIYEDNQRFYSVAFFVNKNTYTHKSTSVQDSEKNLTVCKGRLISDGGGVQPPNGVAPLVIMGQHHGNVTKGFKRDQKLGPEFGGEW